MPSPLVSMRVRQKSVSEHNSFTHHTYDRLPGFCLCSSRIESYGLHMKARYIFAAALCIAYAAIPSCATGHPTNGHLCTEIQDPIRCFDSDGFCEWVSAQCLYRCDLHNTAPDCEDIKDGCAWDGRHCIQVPSTLDAGTLPTDAARPYQQDASEDTVDTALVDSTQEPDSEAPPTDAVPRRHHTDSSAHFNHDEGGPNENQPGQAAQNCTVGNGTPLTSYLVFCVLLRMRRRL